MKTKVIAFDIDGTLADYGGPVSRDMLEELKRKGWTVGLVSGRADTHRVAESLGVEVSVIGKEDALRNVAEKFPEAVMKVYCGDQVSDEIAAKNAHWDFTYARDFRVELF